MKNEIVEAAPTAIATQRGPNATPADLVQYALQSGADMERLERLMAMQIQWEQHEAKKAYVTAMAAFKKNPPEIYKTKLVEFSGTSYKHATLGDVAQAVIHSLAEHGFSHRWDVEQPGDGRIIVRCIITHELGHSETNTMESVADNSGKKNAIQAVASAITYMQRYTLLAATGLAVKDEGSDDDGAGYDRDYTLQNKYVSLVAVTNLDGLMSLYQKGTKEFSDAKDLEGYKAFKAALTARKLELGGGTNGQ